MFFPKLFFVYIFLEFTVSKDPFEEILIDVPIDHFSFPKNNETFPLRYLVIEHYYVKGCVTFFFCGNEGDITVFLDNSGFLLEIAPIFNALVVFAEHRYYGKSLPFGNKSLASPEHLRYLTTSQALADFVWVIDALNKKYYKTMVSLDTFPVIAFGGSYGGMLSAWLRIKYPHMVLAAIASSAPILQLNNLETCETFYQIVTEAFTRNNNCSVPINISWQAIRNVTKTDDGKKNVSEVFKLCKPIKTEDDIDKLVDAISDIYVNIAMLNYPYPSNLMSHLPANPVKAFCDKLKSFGIVKSALELLEAVSSALQIYTNFTGSAKCNNFETTLENPTEYAWDFQACFELIMPMCSSNQDMFETTQWDYKNFSTDCFKRFGVHPVRPDKSLLEYGGKNLKYATNIVFSNGMMDPWSSGGVLRNVSSSVLAVLIPEAAHHYDLRSSDPTDSNYVLEARKFHVNAIKRWLNIT